MGIVHIHPIGECFTISTFIAMLHNDLQQTHSQSHLIANISSSCTMRELFPISNQMSSNSQHVFITEKTCTARMQFSVGNDHFLGIQIVLPTQLSTYAQYCSYF